MFLWPQRTSPVPSELLVGVLPAVQMEMLSPAMTDCTKTQPQTGAVSDQEDHMVSHQPDEVSPHSDSENAQIICSPAQNQDSTRPASSTFSSPPGSESSVSQTSAPQFHIEPQVPYQVPHQLQVSQTQVNVSQPAAQVQVSHHEPSGQSSVRSSPPPQCLSISVPQQQTVLTAAPASLSKPGDTLAVQQPPQNSELIERNGGWADIAANVRLLISNSATSCVIRVPVLFLRTHSCLGRGE